MPTTETQTPSLRAQVAFCCMMAFTFAWLVAYALDENKILVVIILAVLCGLILDFPQTISLKKIAVYCIPVEISVILSMVLGYLIFNIGKDYEKDMILIFLSIAGLTYPLLIVCCIARPVSINVLSSTFEFVGNSGLHLSIFAKTLVTVVLMIFGIGQTDLLDVVQKVWSPP